ncbi:Aldose 1-epimerase (Galactose mutarotase) (Type-1 mutarotase), partial [Durusdinium trenchii]
NDDAAAAVEVSVSFDGPQWDVGLPKHYRYEDEYTVGEGASARVDDDLEKPDLQNKFTNVPGRMFQLRGPEYLKESTTNNLSLKQPSLAPAYTCVGINVFQAKSDLCHAAEKVKCLKAYLSEMEEYDRKLAATPEGKYMEGDAPMYLVYCWVFSNFFRTEYTCGVHLCRRNMRIDSGGEGDDPALDRTFGRWLKMPDKEKNNKLKFVAQFREANPSLMATIDMLGGQRPVLIANKLTPQYHRGSNYIEIDLDVGSSNVAAMLNGVALKSSGKFAFDECVCVEGQAEDELPERALFSVRQMRHLTLILPIFSCRILSPWPPCPAAPLRSLAALCLPAISFAVCFFVRGLLLGRQWCGAQSAQTVIRFLVLATGPLPDLPDRQLEGRAAERRRRRAGMSVQAEELRMRCAEGGGACRSPRVKFAIRDLRGAVCEVASFGATVLSLRVGREDHEVTRLIDREALPCRAGTYAGAAVGRVANRIAGPAFELDGRRFELERLAEDKPFMLHGGSHGLHQKNWRLRELVLNDEEVGVVLEVESPDLEGGFPGNLTVRARITLARQGDTELRFVFQAETDKPTIVNICNHAYWNLSTRPFASIKDHVLQLNCPTFVKVDDNALPDGTFEPVAGTVMDFSQS